MRVLILGGGGMLGHRLSRAWQNDFEVWATYRRPVSDYQKYSLMEQSHQIGSIDVEQPAVIETMIKQIKPDVVVNCVGLVKQREHGQRRTLSAVNALFPHLLASYCYENECRLIHISTDCVFSGRKGFYTEQDSPDPVDEYGMSKLLGEPLMPHVLTLRTSLIGWELNHFTSLLEWFAAQRGKTIKGYRKALFSGFTTQAIAPLLAQIMLKEPAISGLYHLASAPINKFDLLQTCIEQFKWHDINLIADDSFSIDRSLNGKKLDAIMGWRTPTWTAMIDDLYQDWSWYEKSRIG